MKTVSALLFSMIISFNSFSLEFLDVKVSLLSGEQVMLEWNSVNEANSDSYTLEISQNAIDFKSFASVKSIGNSTSHIYKITHSLSFSGTAYFRIRHIDYDGNITYSGIESLTKQEAEVEISIYPNPSTGETINLRVDSKDPDSNQTIKLIGRTGRVIYESSLNSGAFDHQFNLEKGYYFLWLTESNGNVITKKIVVN
jgi:hypothetical protein